MPIQSSFLIRCWLESNDPNATVKRYHIEHVQSGKSCQSAHIQDILNWLNETNRHMVADSSLSPSDEKGAL